mmetsp:Transcript_12302/g.18878  ORF Transcript_12302/g.18878 Transcript_12302/m.18878 type:complete len:220 (+) Transcript_12302:689-1348(+)
MRRLAIHNNIINNHGEDTTRHIIDTGVIRQNHQDMEIMKDMTIIGMIDTQTVSAVQITTILPWLQGAIVHPWLQGAIEHMGIMVILTMLRIRTIACIPPLRPSEYLKYHRPTRRGQDQDVAMNTTIKSQAQNPPQPQNHCIMCTSVEVTNKSIIVMAAVWSISKMMAVILAIALVTMIIKENIIVEMSITLIHHLQMATERSIMLEKVGHMNQALVQML